MVKFKWRANKILLQRVVLLTIVGMISCGILKGHMDYEKQVSEYMRSLEYRRAREASQDYRVNLMKNNQRLFSSDQFPPPLTDQD